MDEVTSLPSFTTTWDISSSSIPASQEEEEEEAISIGTEVFYRFRQAVLWISFLMAVVTLSVILCHRALRRQHHIFSFNVVLADLLGIMTFLVYDFVEIFAIEVLCI